MADTPKVFTHDIAFEIVDAFDDLLLRYGIKVPSDEDDERGDDNDVALYGSTFSYIHDVVENYILASVQYVQSNPNCKIVPYEYSGRPGITWVGRGV